MQKARKKNDDSDENEVICSDSNGIFICVFWPAFTFSTQNNCVAHLNLLPLNSFYRSVMFDSSSCRLLSEILFRFIVIFFSIFKEPKHSKSKYVFPFFGCAVRTNLRIKKKNKNMRHCEFVYLLFDMLNSQWLQLTGSRPTFYLLIYSNG